jgi:hypothetical protein
LHHYLIFFGGFVLGCLAGVLFVGAMTLPAMSSRSSRQEEAEAAALLSGPVGINAARLLGIELPPASNTPGDPAAGYHRGSAADTRD